MLKEVSDIHISCHELNYSFFFVPADPGVRPVAAVAVVETVAAADERGVSLVLICLPCRGF